MGSGLYAGQTLPDSGLPMLLLDGGGLAQAAGLRFHREVIAASEDADEAAIPALLFDDLDGCRRAMPLGAIDRVEKAEAAAVHHSGSRVRLVVGETTMPLHHVDARALDRATVGARSRCCA
jgi:two-component system chemotaxis sensor kinase CheA